MTTCRPNNLLLRLAAIGISVFALLICVADQSYADGADGQDPKGGGSEPRSVFAPGQLVVKFSSDTVYSDVFLEGVGAVQESYLPLSGVYLYELNSEGEPEDIADSLNQLDKVEYAHPNYLMDELHPVQGSYPMSDKAETGSYDNQPATATLDLASAQEITSGSGVTVAVIDGGVDFGHSRLLGTELPGYDFVENDDYPFDEPGGRCSGHGTFVAGIVHLAAPDAKIRAYRVTDPGGNGDGFTLAQAIERAVNDGCQVINLSLVLMGEHLAVRDAISYAISQGVVVVAAAGNQGTTTAIYPGAWNNTIAVAAIDSTAVLADFSCFGSHIDVCAPGTNIYSTYLDNGYAWWSGTSFATPFVTAQAALALSLSPTPTWSQVINAVATTAVNIDEPNANHVGMIGSGLCSPTGAVEWLNAACGDVNGDGKINILDLTKLIDYLWLGGPPVNPAVVEGLDGVAGITNHDMYALADYMYYSFDPLTCEITADVFPASPDVLMFAGVAVPADRSLWMVDVWVNILDPYYGVAAAFAYDCPTSAIVLDTIIWQTDGGLIQAYLVDNAAQKVALVVNKLTEEPPTGGYRHLATLGFTVTPSSEPQVINFELTQYPFSESDHVTVISKPGADSLEGVVPQLQSMEERMGGAEVATVSPNVLNFTGDPYTYSFLRKTAWLSSTNAPAHYVGRKISTGNDFIFFEDSTHYAYDSISGQTNDSIYIVVIPSQAPGPGLYVDSISFEVEGVDDLVLLTVKVVLESSAPAACCEMIGDVNGNGIAYEVDDATVLAAAISEGDTSYFPCIGNADITGDCLVDTVDLYVMEAIISGDSIFPPSECGGCESYELISGSIIHSAAVNPDTLYASFPEDIELLVAPTVSAWLTSTNAPAHYSPEMVSAEPIFASVDTAGGWTNDSVVVTLNPSPGPVGTYYNTILFHVDGVTDPAELTIRLTVTPPGTGSYASISPNVMDFYGNPYTYSFLTKVGWLSSTNAPANYLGTKKTPGNDFIFFEDSTQIVYDSIQGQTNDSIIIVVIPSQSPGPGLYTDSILFEVDGVTDPVLLVVNVTLDSMGQAACCVMPGDIDGDGYPYSLADLAGLEAILVTGDMTPIQYCPGNADVTGDCVIDYADLSYINSVIMGWGPMPPFAECGSCYSYTLGTTPTVAIQSLQQVQLGQPASVAVTLDNWGVGIGGFELLFSHDANVLNFLSAIPGPEFFDLSPAGCGWEYFTYQTDANGIRVVGVADLNNGEVHPNCTMASPLPATLFTLEFMTTDDRTLLGQNTPIDFRWVECGDNTFSSVTGENLYFDRVIYNADGSLIWDELDDDQFPEEARIPFVGISDSCFSLVPGSSVNIRYVAFMNGGVTIDDEGESCCVEPGDVNENGLAYEIADRYLLADVLANPDTVTLSCLGNADVTGDCLVDTADLTFLDAVIAGDAVPVAECGICTAYELIPDTVSPGGEMVSVWPTGLNYSAPVDSMVVQEGVFFLSSTNAPANYTAAIKDEADFTTLQNFAGTTNDSIRFLVQGGLGLTPGLYVDTLVFEVEGTENSPLKAVLTLTVEEYGGPADSAWVYPSVLTFDVPPGVSDTLLGSVLVGSTNDPAPYGAQVLGGPASFVSLLDTIGMTYDSAWIRVDPSLPDTGWYYDTVEFWVSGIEQPAVLEVRLWINPNDSMPAFNLGNHPNPFNAQTNIVFDLPSAAHVRLRVYNIVGRLVTTVVDEYREAGQHSVPWHGDGLASGIYFYRMEAGEVTATRKMVLLK